MIVVNANFANYNIKKNIKEIRHYLKIINFALDLMPLSFGNKKHYACQ